ncbi:MAG: SDR family NAD(P)-dependent oxidoreductase, partial [Ilumatobacteraceae bacterium]
MPGGGAQYAGMGLGLYDTEAIYRAVIDECCAVARDRLGIELYAALYPDEDDAEADVRLERPSLALPALFATELAMSSLLASWGIVPVAMIGHSAGEYVAACLAGVISAADGMTLLGMRGRLFETLPGGAMLSVALPAAQAETLLPHGLSIAAANAAKLCVVSGPVELIGELEARLAADDVDTARVHIDVAAHSAMLEPILDEFAALCRTVKFSVPATPYISNLTGTWVTAAEVTDPDYWVRHLRNTVRFGEGIATVLAEPNRVLLEVGPGRTLTAFARMAATSAATILPTIRHPREQSSDLEYLLGAIGRAWMAGVPLDAAKLFAGQRRRRVPLPTYPFERRRYWVEPDAATVGARSALKPGALRKRTEIADWFATPTWRRSPPPAAPPVSPPGGGASMAAERTWLLVVDGAAIADELRVRLGEAGGRLVTVRLGERFARLGDSSFVVDPARSSDWIELVESLKAAAAMPDDVVHVTSVGPSRGRRRFGRDDDALTALEATVERDYASLMFLLQALSATPRPMRLTVITSGVHVVGAAGEPPSGGLHPERALLHGVCRVAPREFGLLQSTSIDIDGQTPGSPASHHVVQQLVAELLAGGAGEDVSADPVVAYRRGERWVRGFDPVRLPPAVAVPWRPGGTYLITGGLGGIGLAVAEHIAATVRGVTLALVGRTAMIDESAWPAALASQATDQVTRRRIEAVQRLRSSGATVLLACADVTDEVAMTAMLENITARCGRITGVVHAAGLLRDALIALRTPTVAAPVIDVKAKGVIIVDRILSRRLPPELTVLCSSVSSLIGLPGQADYTAANAFLDAFAAARSIAGDTRVVSVNWSAWQQVGMAVRAAREVDERGSTGAHVASPTAMFDSLVVDGDTVLATTAFNRAARWLLGEHVVRGGDAVLPGTGYLELIRQIANAVGGTTSATVRLSEVVFLTPFAVGPDETRVLHVKLQRCSGAVVVYSDLEATPHVTARVIGSADVVAGAAQSPPIHDLSAARLACDVRHEEFNGYSKQEFMDFGPRWGSLRRVDYGTNEALVT